MRHMKRPLLISVFVASSLALGATPVPVGYAQATGYLKKDSRPTLYQPLNLLDGREATAWCTPGADPLNELISIGFKGTATIDELRVYTGNGFDENSFKTFSRARKFSIRGMAGAQVFTIADQRGLQAVQFNPPITGAQVSIEVLDQYPADDADASVCVTDFIFVTQGKPLNGTWLTEKLKYHKSRAPLLGTWFAGHEGAPDRFLAFFFDGTYRFVYDPYDPQVKDRVFSGEYDVNGASIVLEIPGKGKVSAHVKKGAPSKENPRAARTMVLDGDLPDDLKQPYRDQL
jgi:hypothetical protein